MPTDKCQLCSNVGASKPPKYSTLDDRKTHAQFHLFQLGYIGDENIALRRVFEQCFLSTEMFPNCQTKTANRDNEEKKVEKSRFTLLLLCRKLIKNRNGSTSLFCRECSSNVRYAKFQSARGRLCHDASLVLNHVVSHSATKPYQCPYCEYGSIHVCNAIRHVKTSHEPAVSDDSIVEDQEYWSANFDDIVASLGKCFEGVDPDATIGSDLRNQQLRRCGELLRMYANKEKELRCFLCRKWISTNGQSSDVHRHIRVHLHKPVYKCKKCSAMFKWRQGVWAHLNRRHKNSSAKDIVEDLSDKYHSEIMKLATKCFDMQSNS